MDQRTDDKPHPELCCCPPRALIWGSTSSTAVGLTNRMEEDEHLQVRSDANASYQPPGGPFTNADGSGGSQVQTRIRKEVDAVCLTATYRLSWRVEASCRPVAVSLDVGGEVTTELRCLDVEGSIDLSRVKALEYAELRTRTPGSVKATLRVVDCAGNRAECSVVLREP